MFGYANKNKYSETCNQFEFQSVFNNVDFTT